MEVSVFRIGFENDDALTDNFFVGLLSKADLHKLRTDEVVTLADSGGKQIREFNFLSLGIMAYLGDDRASKLRGGCAFQLFGRTEF